MGQVPAAPQSQTGHQTGNHRDVAGKRKKQRKGLRGCSEAGYVLYQ